MASNGGAPLNRAHQIRNRAHQIRIDRGDGKKRVCDEARISPVTLERIESGELVAAASLKRLADFYGVRASTLLGPPADDDPEPNGSGLAAAA